MRKTSVREFSYSLRQRHRSNVFFLALYVCCIILICTVILDCFLFSVGTKSSSMEPTIESNDLFLVTPLAAPKDFEHDSIFSAIFQSIPLERGDLVYVRRSTKDKKNIFSSIIDALVRFVSFQHTDKEYASNLTTEAPVIRRIVAFPGDTIYMKDFVLYVKQEGEAHFLTEFEITDKQYDIAVDALPSNWDIATGFAGNMDKITLKDDEYFVLADNRFNASDSRLFGVVPFDSIGGKVFLRYFPFTRFSLL